MTRRGDFSAVDPFAPGISRFEAESALAARFTALGAERPRFEARSVLRSADAIAPASWIAEPEAPLRDRERARMFAERRLAGEPLSRIVGAREFWSLPFTLSPAVLDPRPDTETLVEAVLALFAARRDDPLRVLDLGVGSGAILAALLSEWPNARGIGLDKSAEAALLAGANLTALGLRERSQVIVSDWDAALGDATFEAIVSNPPYIRTGDIAGLEREVKDHDPLLALDGGVDGLDAYRALAPVIARRLAPTTGRFAVEFGEGQAADVAAIVAAAGLQVTGIVKDLAGRDRVIVGGA